MSDLYQMIADRLKTDLPHLQDVRAATSAREMDAAFLGELATVHVVPAAERWSEPREAALQVVQSGRIAFSCIIGLTFPAGFAAWSQTRTEIRDCLLGWMPDAADVAGPIVASGARLLAYQPQDGGKWLHALDFTVAAQATITAQT